MTDAPKGFGEQLFSRLKDQGLSRGRVYKALALQRLDSEVADLGAQGILNDAQLLEISKIASAARQKQLAELAVMKELPVSWVKELSKVIRNAEKAHTEAEANPYWDFFFDIKDRIEKEGPTRALFTRLKGFHVEKPSPAEAKEETVEHPDRRVASFNRMDLELGRSLDVGTVNICAAATKREGGTVYNIQRNAFLDVRSDTFTKKMLMKLGIDYIVQGSKGYVIGDPAFELANIFERNTRRPMKDGMISPVETEALLIVSLLAAQLLGHPQTVGEPCAFSVPAEPIDADRNVIYHRGALETVLRKLGYAPKPMYEGHAVVFAELKEQDYTGIGVSCGGGMFNVCVAYKSVPAIAFSTSRGGDWIDNNVATALGMPTSLVCAAKEGGVNLLDPKDRVQDAIVIYYRNLIQYTLETIKQQLGSAQNMPIFSNPIELVCAGGTSLIGGFIDVFREEFKRVNFPVEVARIRLAHDPLRSVATGCLQAAAEEMRALHEDPTIVAPATLARSAVTQTDQAKAPPKRPAPPPPPPPLQPALEEVEDIHADPPPAKKEPPGDLPLIS